jgi:hypothetical protein
MRRLRSSLFAGAVAIMLNTLALRAADLIGLQTAHGGLLRLLSRWFSSSIQYLGISSLWSAAGLAEPNSAVFQTGFHLCVGMVMALFYSFALEPVLLGGPLAKGSIYAAALWLLNACLILPTTGEGFAGSAHLSTAGMGWFAVAHTIFFLTLAYLFAYLMQLPLRTTLPPRMGPQAGTNRAEGSG